MGAGQRLLEGLKSAVVVGRDVVQFQGVPNPCEVVRAKYSKLPVFVTAAGSGPTLVTAPSTRTLCVDRARNLILRDDILAEITSGPLAAQGVEVQCTFVPTSVERDPELPPELFAFAPPEGSHFSESLTYTFLENLPPGVYRIGGGVSVPVVVSKRNPWYTPEARIAHIQGTVLLRMVIGADGIPRDVVVARSLDPGLDREAITAVKAWRFRPGMKDGKPVAVLVTVEVSFRLRDRPPGSAVDRWEPGW
jgi:TonB family protein